MFDNVFEFGICSVAINISRDNLARAKRVAKQVERKLNPMHGRVRVEDHRGCYTVVIEAADQGTLPICRTLLEGWVIK